MAVLASGEAVVVKALFAEGCEEKIGGGIFQLHGPEKDVTAAAIMGDDCSRGSCFGEEEGMVHVGGSEGFFGFDKAGFAAGEEDSVKSTTLYLLLTAGLGLSLGFG